MSERGVSRCLLAVAVALVAASSWRALLGGAPEHSDHALHLAALLRMGDALARGESPLDHWFAGAAFGYPLFRVYPPLGHLLALALSLISHAPLEAALAWVRFSCLCALPFSVDRGLRWAGLSRLAAAWGGALCLAPCSAFGFGMELGSFLPRGHGLFAQLVAMNACALALGAVLRAVREEQRSGAGAAATLWLSLAVLAHPALALFTAAAAFAGALATPGPLRPRLSTLLRIGLGVALLTAWYLVPALLDRAWILRSRWEPAWKWDSFGARAVLAGLLAGQLLDFGRLPVLTVLCAAGLAVALLRREVRPWLAVAALSLLVACGPMSFSSLPGLGMLQLHRAIAVLHLALIGLAGLGAAQLTRALVAPLRSRRLAWASALLAALVLGALARDRRGLMAAAELSAADLADLRDLHQVIARVRAILEEQPGRAYAGAANGWGESFRAAGVPVYAHLEGAGVDTLGFLFHALGVASDAAPEFDENSLVEQEVFGVAVMVLSLERAAPPALVLDRQIGTFAIYRNPRAGLFRIASIAEGVAAPPDDLYPVVAQLRRGPAGLSRTLIASMQGDAPGISRWLSPDRLQPSLPLASAPAEPAAAPGQVEQVRAAGNHFAATVRLEQAAWLVLAMTAHPGWRATVDGRPADTAIATPGFVAVHLDAGPHAVAFDYEAGALKARLFVLALLGAIALAASWRRERRTVHQSQVPVASR